MLRIELWVRRLRWAASIAAVLTPAELRARYRQSTGRGAWILLGPVALVVAYTLLFDRALGIETACSPYLSSAWLGMVIWTFFATAFASATSSLHSSSHLITRFTFPMEAVPWSRVAVALVDLAVGMVTVAAVALLQGIRPGWWAVLLVLPLALVVIWGTVLGLIGAIVACFWRDTNDLVGLLLRLGFFLTPVVYEAQQVPLQFRWAERLNPIAVAITETRNCLLCNSAPSLRLLSVHLLVAVAALGLALRASAAKQARIVDII